MHFKDFIKIQTREKNIEKVKLNKKEEISDYSENENDTIEKIDSNFHEEFNEIDKNVPDTLNNKADNIDINSSFEYDILTKIEETDEQNYSQKNINYNLSYPISEYQNLNKKCQEIVKEAEMDPLKQLQISKSLFNGENQFPVNINIGKQYLNKSLKGKCFESIIYYIDLLIKGSIVPKNLKKAKKILNNHQHNKDVRLLILRGKIAMKEKLYSQAIKYFEEGLRNDDPQCMYEYAKMLFQGKGIKKNDKKAFKYFKKSSDKGFQKSTRFFDVFNQMKEINEFNNLNSETQLFFVKRCIKNNNDNIFKQIIISPNKTEMLFYNNSFKSIDFYIFLSIFKDILIEIQFPSDTFKTLLEFIIKVQVKHIKQANIGVVFTSFPQDISDVLQNANNFHFRIDSSVEFIPNFCFKNCSTLKQIFIPPSVVTIKNSSFVSCTSLTQISIPSSVTSIEEGVFDGCSSLEQVTLAYSINSIRNFTFNECTSLKEIIIPHSVTSIGEYAFNGCKSLTKIIIPDSVTSIGKNIFSGCSSLIDLSFSSSITSIKEWSFRGCSSLKQISITLSVTSIGNHAFEECSSFEKISIPSSVDAIPLYAFRGCTSLSEILIPSSVTSIMDYAFSGCSSLRQVVIPSSVTEIKCSSFIGCSSLIQISIPSVISIESNAFHGCSSMKDISLPSSLTCIGDNAFKGCSSLTKIAIPNSVNSIGENVFIDCSSLKYAIVPSHIDNSKIGIGPNVEIEVI